MTKFKMGDIIINYAYSVIIVDIDPFNGVYLIKSNYKIYREQDIDLTDAHYKLYSDVFRRGDVSG